MTRLIRTALTTLGTWTTHPAAFLLALAYVIAWVALDWHDFRWHEAVVAATLFMTLLIQRAEHRDTQAIHAKLDELLRASGAARDELSHIDRKEPEEVEQQRNAERGGGDR